MKLKVTKKCLFNFLKFKNILILHFIFEAKYKISFFLTKKEECLLKSSRSRLTTTTTTTKEEGESGTADVCIYTIHF
jgi:hypothetical protein